MPMIIKMTPPGVRHGYLVFQRAYDETEFAELASRIPDMDHAKVMAVYRSHSTAMGWALVQNVATPWIIVVQREDDLLVTLGHEAYHIADLITVIHPGRQLTKQEEDEVRAEVAGIIVGQGYRVYTQQPQPQPPQHARPAIRPVDSLVRGFGNAFKSVGKGFVSPFIGVTAALDKTSTLFFD